MAPRKSGVKRRAKAGKRATGASRRTLQRRSEGGEREPAAQLAAEIEALREQLRQSRARIATLEKHSHEDALTGLLNRRGFAQAFLRTTAYCKRYGAAAALLYLDLDRFKPINDTHGHQVGDVVLSEIARLISGSVRASDIVARIGGDEIAVLLWNIDAAQAEAKARAIEELVAQAGFEFANVKFGVGVSAGVTLLSGDDKIEDAMQRADAAMYRRKRERKAQRK